jgi:hypothetical protein
MSELTAVLNDQLPPPPAEIIVPPELLITSIVTPSSEGVYVKGEWCTPETHAWRDGAPILRVDGTAKKKPGRSGPRTAAPVGEQTVEVEKKVKAAPATDIATLVASAGNAAPAAPVAAAPVALPVPPVKTEVRAPPTLTVSKAYGKIATPEDSTETLEVRNFQTAPATVEIGYGLTLNIGNYESARVDVKVSVPCYREEVEDAYAFAKKWAEDKVKQEVADIRKLSSAKPTNNNPF